MTPAILNICIFIECEYYSTWQVSPISPDPNHCQQQSAQVQQRERYREPTNQARLVKLVDKYADNGHGLDHESEIRLVKLVDLDQ